MPAIEQMLKTLAYVPWYRDRICVLVDASVPDARLNEWKTYLGDEGQRVRRLGRNGIEYYYPSRVMTELTTVPGDRLTDSLDQFIDSIRLGNRSAQLGEFAGSKRELARELAERLSFDDLADIDPILKEIIEVLKAKRFSLSAS